MDTTFISIHDLSLDARLLYVSSSIADILGYSPHEVIGKSCWEYFHPDEIPFARAVHGRGVQLDKAAVLNYCQIKNREGRWVGCECVFTIVYDVLVASTSVYRYGSKSQKRAKDAPIVRQLFSSSPRDPRYHMLSYISQKFSQELRPHSHEPRAALFLNRFTRTLTIMYATNGLADVLGISADELNGKSFYYCIQENCLQEAVRCLESAKANDSIAYLRFWFRDPREDDQAHQDQQADGHSSGDEDDGGVHLGDRLAEERNGRLSQHTLSRHDARSMGDMAGTPSPDRQSLEPCPGSISGNSTDVDMQGNDAIFDQPPTSQSSSSSLSASDEGRRSSPARQLPAPFEIELEAVVSCTSDGLVVILRRARPLFPQVAQPTGPAIAHPYTNGLFASPWATDPILPDCQFRPMYDQPSWVQPHQAPIYPAAAQAYTAASMGPASEDFMRSIREVAVFAWALTGINGSLAQYGRGKPVGECLPPGGLPIWDPNSNPAGESGIYHGLGSGVERNQPVRYQNEMIDYKGHSSGGGSGYPSLSDRTPTNPWAYGAPPETKSWDRGLPNGSGSYEFGRYDDMRRLG